MLEASGVTRFYPTPRGPLTVVSDVSLTLAPGEAAAITGPSGSGKSTLLCMLGGLERPSAGTIRLDGQDPYALDPTRLAEFRNRQVGFVFQDHCLLPQLSALENVLVPMLVGRRRSREAEADVARARALLERVGLGARVDHRPSQLSGGEKQRVALARALIREPRLVLCDEPTGNLDPASADTVASLLVELHAAQRNVLVVVTHSPRVASRFPVRFALEGGRMRTPP